MGPTFRAPKWGPLCAAFCKQTSSTCAAPQLRAECSCNHFDLRSCATHDGRLHAAHVQQLSALGQLFGTSALQSERPTTKSFGQARLHALTCSRVAHSASAMFLTQKAAPILGSKKRPQKRAPPAPVLKKDNEQLRRPPFWGPRSGPQNGGRFALHFANKRAPPALRRNCGRSVLATTSTCGLVRRMMAGCMPHTSSNWGGPSTRPQIWSGFWTQFWGLLPNVFHREFAPSRKTEAPVSSN